MISSSYQRRLTREVKVGHVGIGGANPIRVQSMITCDTMDTEACIQQSLELANAGCEIVRITAPTVNDAANLRNIVRGLRERGCAAPIVADIHFKPDAALEAAKWVEKVRVNPGNYADTKKFKIVEYTDAQYAEELERIRSRFAPLVAFCKEHGVALRIGANHGSLSDRIMNRYGDSPLGMVESALEFAHIARDGGCHDFVFSMKASNAKVVIQTYRLLVARLDALGPDWNYPIHLGVTEAGDGEDGRIKSAIGIGSLLSDGIGDTIRVSLTEDSVHEIPVAQALVAPFNTRLTVPGVLQSAPAPLEIRVATPFEYRRRASARMEIQGAALGGEETIRVFTTQEKWDVVAHKIDRLGDYKPEAVADCSGVVEIDPHDSAAVAALDATREPRLVAIADHTGMEPVEAYRLLASRVAERHPILLKDTFRPAQPEANRAFLDTLLESSSAIGSLLCDGIGDAVLVRGEAAAAPALRLSYNILQAAGARIFKTDYVACPSCGRTLFNLQETTARIKAATSHLKGVKIAIMGCIVNGPGEMADADFGYVGGAPGKVNLYVGKTAVKFNIPEVEAVDRLQDLIREHGKWTDPVPETPA